MTRSELIDKLCTANPQLSIKDVELASRIILSSLTKALMNQKRIEIRGFGSFSVRQRAARLARNPKTGEKVKSPATLMTYFKPGNELRDSVNESLVGG